MTAIYNTTLKILLIAVFVFSGILIKAEEPADTVKLETKPLRESLVSKNFFSLAKSHFTWGAELSSSIDLRGNNMSTFDIDVLLGYKNSYLRTIGIIAGLHRSFQSKNIFIPIDFLLRTSFRPKPSLLFFDLKAGYSFNTISNSASRGGVNASLGLGINLAMSKKFQSHIVLSYCFFHINSKTRNEREMENKYVDLMRISLGINF